VISVHITLHIFIVTPRGSVQVEVEEQSCETSTSRRGVVAAFCAATLTSATSVLPASAADDKPGIEIGVTPTELTSR
jgi:hypothetical protein